MRPTYESFHFPHFPHAHARHHATPLTAQPREFVHRCARAFRSLLSREGAVVH